MIADDLTGALDAGIQFRGGRVSLRIGAEHAAADLSAEGRARVLVVDAETRHLAPEEAGRIVGSLARQAASCGVSTVYKKTDSALRGNVGSELQALLDAFGGGRVHFAPAYPAMGRVTRGGVHYINGLPVADSAFGRDPYEPVRSSRVAEILEQNWPATAWAVRAGEIRICDGSSDGDLEAAAGEALAGPGPHLLAGCAGFAAAAAKQLGFYQAEGPCPEPAGSGIAVLCGSTNPVTLQQLDAAERSGALRLRLRPEEKLDRRWMDTREGMGVLENWERQLEASPCAILESASDPAGEDLQGCVQRMGIEREEVRLRIAGAMGEIGKRLLDLGLCRPLLVTGGDTLLAFLRAVDPEGLEPCCELFPGIVYTQMTYRGRRYDLISKSGGFGAPDLIEKLRDRIDRPGPRRAPER